MKELDKLSKSILEELNKNAKTPIHIIAKRLGAPITTVHHRIKKLEEGGIIKSYKPVIDYVKAGKPIAAFIMITVDYNSLKNKKISQYDLMRSLNNIEHVVSSAMVTGISDIIIKIRVASMEELNDFVTIKLRNIDGIEKTNTAIILNEA